MNKKKDRKIELSSGSVGQVIKVFRWLVPCLVLIGLIGYLLRQSSSTPNRSLIYQTGIDKTLFDSKTKKPVPTTFESIKQLITKPKPKPERKPAKPAKKTSKAVPKPRQVAKRSTSAVFASRPALINETEKFRTDYNQKRRLGKEPAIKTVPISQKEPSISKKARWENVSTDIASFPTDMSRVVLEGTFISALLIESINSELDGLVRATIQRNVYGGEGRLVLIPAGSQAIGRYKTDGGAGRERLMIHWHRIITPNGININTLNAEMSDQQGRSGIAGKIDRKYFRRYGMTFLISFLSAVASLNVPVKTEYQADVVSNFSGNILDLTREVLRDNLQNNRPTITIPAGTKFIIRPVRDVFFPFPSKRNVQLLGI